MTMSLSQPWRVAVFLMLTAAINYADRAALSAVLPALRVEMKLSDAAIGLLGSLFLWSYAIGSPIAGYIGDRYSRRKLVLGSLVAWSCVTIASGFATGFNQLALLRIALGFAECVYVPVAIALLAEEHGPASRGRAMSLHGVGMSLGVVVGGTLAGVLAENFGWRSGFWVLGFIGIGLFAISKSFLGPRPPGSGPEAPPVPKTKPRVSVREAFSFIMKTPTYYVLLGTASMNAIGIWIFMVWLPLYFNEKYMMTMGKAGFAGTFFIALPAILGHVYGGFVSDWAARHGIRRRMFVFALFYFLAAPCLIGFVAGVPLYLLYALIALFSFLRSTGGSNEQPIMCDVIPSAYRSTAQGIMNACATGCGGAAVWIAGILKARAGLGTIFAGISTMFVIAGVVIVVGYFFLVRKDSERARLYEERMQTAG